ncbi:MAG: hypothetical protein ACRENY_04950 [Candidatus Dormibacteria bacterium]
MDDSSNSEQVFQIPPVEWNLAPDSGPTIGQRRAALLARAAAADPTEPERISIRSLLALWGAQRRGYQVVAQVSRALKVAGLTTEPPFTQGGMDDIVKLEHLSRETPVDSEAESVVRSVGVRVGSLPSATGKLVTVAPQDTIQRAQTLMLLHDYSQLGVIQSKYDRPLAITWESVAKALLREAAISFVHQATVDAPVVSPQAELLDSIPDIVRVGFVFVSGPAPGLPGIVTTADLSQQFADLAGPFMLLSEIELRLRNSIGTVFSAAEMSNVADSAEGRSVASVDDLTLGEMLRLLEPPEQWERLRWQLDRKEFVNALHRVREMRNEVMHFSPDPLEQTELGDIRAFLKCLRTLQSAKGD